MVADVYVAYKYRIYPKPRQERLLKSHLAALCSLYNTLRDLKLKTWRERHVSLSEYDLKNIALEKRRRDRVLSSIHSQVVQEVASRVHRAFRNYFEGRARFPKRKKPRKYRSLTYPQSGFKLCGKLVWKGKRTELKGKLYLSKIGHVRIFMHRPIEGKVKTLSIKYDAGEWYAIFICEVQDRPKKPIEEIEEDRIIGGDLGLYRFLTLSDGRSAGYPKYLRRSEEKIKRLQRILSRAKKGSKNFRRLTLRIARLHLHVRRQRENFQNQIIAALYREADVVFLEKMRVKNLLRNHKLAKSLQDSAFSQFIVKAKFKADLQGKWFVPVDPWGTSQFCWSCLAWVPKKIGEPMHECPKCGEKLPRSENSARLIRRLGLAVLPSLRLGYAPGRGVNTPAKPIISLRRLRAMGGTGSPSLLQ